MHRAVYANDEPRLRLLMSERPDGLKQTDHHGNTPLLLALKLGRVEMAWLLIRAGAELDVPSDGSFHLLVSASRCGAWRLCRPSASKEAHTLSLSGVGVVATPSSSIIPVCVGYAPLRLEQPWSDAFGPRCHLSSRGAEVAAD